ncbi:MAG: glycosyltransferase family 39 protein [Flavobacteriales bacterium]|nr:glycosyltransferase family 39 protein [Flavobacteriales bacterium]
MEFLSKYRHLSWVFLLIPIYVFLFVKLGAFHIRLWDEGWFVVHAYEMLEKGSLLVPFYNGQEVFYGSKPPVQTWLQMIFIKTLGYNELAVRLPSAIAAGLTVLLIFHWVRKTSSEVMAWIAALVLLTMDGFVHFHSARGAEADALLTLTIIAQVYFFWEWLGSKRNKDLWALAAMIALSFWVKNVAGFMMLPGLLIYMLMYERDRLMEAVKQKETYIILGVGILGGLSYLLFREIAQPGHMAFLLEKQAGRLVNDVGHDQPFDYYYNRLKDERLRLYLPLVLLAHILPFLFKSESFRPARFAAVLSLSYFLLISIARSKLEWYVMPVYPLSAALVGFGLGSLLKEMPGWKQGLAVVVFIAFPMQVMFRKTQSNVIDYWSKYYEMEEQYLFDAYHQGKNLDGLNVVHDHFDGALLFYKYKFKEIGQHINLQNNVELEIGDRALVNSDKLKEQIATTFIVDTIDQLENAIVYQIKAKRDE